MAQTLRLISVAGAFFLGFWIPVRLLGYSASPVIDLSANFSVSLVAAINIFLYFKTSGLDARKRGSWLNLSLLIDLGCVIPFSLIAPHFMTQILLMNLLCARHIGQVKTFLNAFDSLPPISHRMIPILLTLPLLVHLVACGWIALGSGTAGIDADPMLTYVKGVYWAFTTLTTVGYGDISAKSVPQMLYACLTQVAGVGVFGFILSNVASMLTRADAARERHMDNLDKIETFMRTHSIAGDLKSKTRAYYHYLWTSKKGYQDQSLLEGLPNKLQSELFLFINKSIIEKVPFLKGASPELIEALMNKLEPRIFVPGEKIFKAGDPGDALYLIQSGEVEILTPDLKTIARLGDGAFFGEMALLTEKPRNATARAVRYCDTYLIHRESFNEVTRTYPDFLVHMKEVMQLRNVA